MIKSIILTISLLIMPFLGHAVHLVGGVISYEHTGGNNYEVTLKVYRDCNGGGADFDAPGTVGGPAILGVFSGSNSYINHYEFSFPDVTNIDPTLSGLCENISIPACVEEGVYVMNISLPANASGYQLVYQRCCRNGTIDNIVSPDDTGNTFTAFVPPVADFASNSSPVFDNFPPVALCVNNPLEFDHGASDLDGDSLVYSFCTPFAGADPTVPQPVPPSNPSYNPITWGPDYSEEYQIDADPIFNIDPNSGILTGTPIQQGQYVIGICVQEFRDGEFISEVRRDFQFNVLICPGQPLAVFAEASVISDCTSEVSFQNDSENASEFIWYFGDGNSSTEFEPTHTYLEGGVYEVMLVVGSNNDCSDTTVSVITLNGIPNPVLTDPIFQCIDGQEVYSIEIETIDLFNLEYAWTLDGIEAFGSYTDMIDEIIIEEPGEHILNVLVTDENGCSGTDEVVITINPSPVAGFMVNDGPCSGTTLNFNNTSTDAEEIEWDFGFSGDDALGSGDNVLVNFPNSGEYTVTITATGTEVCSDSYTESVYVSEALFLELEMPDPQCQVGNSSDFLPVGNYAEPATFVWTIDDEILDVESSSLINYSTSQGGNHSFELLVIDANDCELTVLDDFLTVDPLVVNFETAGTGCVPYTAFFNNNTTGGYGLEIEWEFGDGQTSTSPSPHHSYNSVGTFDVTLTVNSTIGCIESQSITQVNALTTYPSPNVGFTVFPLEVNILNPEVSISSDNDSLDCNYFFSDGAFYEDCFFDHTFNDAGLFDITQYITNEFGCSNSMMRTVRVNGHLFYAPSAVTMNDDGLNDFFKPRVIGDIAEYNLEIYDRYGSIVFKTQDPKEGWRPLYSHDGMFNFRVRVRDEHNIPAEYFGSFITIR